MQVQEKALRCNHCGKLINDAEMVKMEEDEIFEKDSDYNITEQTCLECRREVREDRKELEGDYSPLHPDETREEFEEHEDHEVSMNP